MVQVNWYNEKGNVSVKVRDGVRKQVKDALEKALKAHFKKVVENADGGFAVQVGEIASTGTPLYAHFEFKVNDKDPTVKQEKKGKGKKKTQAVVVLPDLFAEEEIEEETEEETDEEETETDDLIENDFEET